MTMSAESAARAEGVGADVGRVQGRVPDFFIVGHHKSGTTAMYEMLRRHPQIFMPEMKEPEFFGRDRSRRREDPAARSGRQARTYAQTRPQNYAEYLALFEAAGAGQCVGEASPSYLYSLTAAAQIAEVRPDARIVAILREPASFLRSLHLQMQRDHVQREPDLRRAIAGEDLAGAGTGTGTGAREPRPSYTDR